MCVYNIYVQYYSDLNKNEILPFATQMNPEGIMIIEIIQTEDRQILHGITHMYNLKRKPQQQRVKQ